MELLLHYLFFWFAVLKVVKTIAKDHDIVDNPNTTIKDDPNAYPWSDIGQSVNSSFEFWKVKNKLKAKPKAKLYETKYQHNNKYASDSNINDAVDMTEPGLRKIPKEAIARHCLRNRMYMIPSYLPNLDAIQDWIEFSSHIIMPCVVHHRTGH